MNALLNLISSCDRASGGCLAILIVLTVIGVFLFGCLGVWKAVFWIIW